MASLSPAQAIAAVTAALAQLPPAESIPESDRLQLLGVMDQVRVAMEPPILTARNLCFAHYGLVGIRGRFPPDHRAVGGDGQGRKLRCVRSAIDGSSVGRILRLLAANHLVIQAADQTYQPLPLALGFTTGSPLAEVIKHFYTNMRASAFLDEYLASHEYRNPEDAWNAPFQWAYQTQEHHFAWLQTHPEDQHAFNVVMGLNRQLDGAQWFDVYPVEDKLRVSPHRVRLVDVGGGLGHDVARCKARFPDMPGKLVVEDLPAVIREIQTPLGEDVEAIACDMFAAQPVHGAKAYYLRTVLHDWPDQQALQVLGRIHEAMAEDSVLLVNENTLPEQAAPAGSVAVDILMMELYASLERTEKQWIDLLQRAHFTVVKVWRAESQGVGSHALYEAVPVGRAL
ncbi:S-adenosyl-L-methionine-dependent methyltransferase [Aspergillus ibericus CBS 121593]|uniref:S-adenosyl-L-methionine-dependent methyltransferase n=1 Tax=Aspergillus ibericus CBS 121593 TaxID=1448316 RepID=A0A395HAC1_9EURO|nr:S-adenosyl-L-methionine-dependent methyltransferase [Aspergillus ibericus CBS 121593]RAL04867.1 S-adenosyl-L-methionine-dependent methyltransferase [Aspergillus ibericus CBS 121593]